mgnify:CR=1 FL=1
MRLIKRFIAPFFLLTFWVTNSTALDLMQAYDLALANDPVFRSATKEYEAGLANLTIGRAGLMPQLSANYYGATNKSTITQPPYSGAANYTSNLNYQSNNGGIQVTQTLFSFQAYASYLQGAAQADSAKSKFLFNSQELLIRVLQAYTDLLNARDQLTFYTSQREAYKEQLKVNENRFKAGEGTRIDILETQASFAMANAQVIEIGDTVENNKRKLEGILGVNLFSAQTLKPLSSHFAIGALQPERFEAWKDSALNLNAEILTAKNNLEVAKQEYRKNLGNNLPTVSAVANWNQQNSFYISTINQNASTSTIGVQASWPIFNGGQSIGQTTQSQALYEKSQADLDVVQTRVITELRKQYDTVMSSKQKIFALQQAVNSATELTKAMKKSIAAGERINMDALLADKGLVTAQRDLSQAKYNYTIALLRLKQLAGTLNTEDFEKVAKFFEVNSQPPKFGSDTGDRLLPQTGNASIKLIPEITLPAILNN